jgi:hypothetical protein
MQYKVRPILMKRLRRNIILGIILGIIFFLKIMYYPIIAGY